MKTYDKGTIAFHWVSAGAILIMWPLGKIMTLGSGRPSSALYAVHIGLGLLVALTTLARVIWVIRHERPERLDMPRWEYVLFALNHYLLYGLLLVLSLSGIGILLTAGSFDAAALAKTGAPAERHELASTAFLLMFVMHVAGVVYYQVRNGRTLRRMGVPLGD